MPSIGIRADVVRHKCRRSASVPMCGVRAQSLRYRPGAVPARVAIAVLCALAALAVPAAAAPPEPEPFGTNDFGGFHDILPPGTSGTANAAQLALFLSTGQRPEHNGNQLPMYGDLVHAAPGLPADQLDKYFKDSTFGVPPDQVERTYSPRDDVVIVRDKQFGVPHIYGATR